MLVAIFTAAAALQIGLAERQSLWADELFSLAVATGHSLEHPASAARSELGDFVEPDHAVPAKEFRRYLKHGHPLEGPERVVRAVFLSDTSPPLYYLFLYCWTLVFGTSDVALRSLSMVCSLACLPLLAAIAERTGERKAVLPACVLFAISPLAIYYSTEARMYSLLWLCLLGTTWASLALHERGGGLARSVFWVATSSAGFLTHYFFVFPWLAAVIYLAISPGKLKRLHLALCTVVTGALILPWYVNLPRSLGGWRITKDWLNWRPWHFSRLVATLELVTQFFDGHAKYLWASHRVPRVAALMLFGIIGVVMVWRLRGHLFRSRLALIWLPFAAACAGPLMFDLVRHTYTAAVPRYAIAALPGACLLAALGLACLQFRTRIVMLVLIALAWAPSVWSIYRQDSRSGEPFAEVSRAVSSGGTLSDLVLVHSIPSGVLGIARYANGIVPMASWVGQLRHRPVPESMIASTAGRRRIFLVKIHEVGAPALEEDWLRANAVVFRETDLEAAKIIEFLPNNGQRF
jgi:4-amino-4-deoxy-L-arabinose transferase-like glycosyltransferase